MIRELWRRQKHRWFPFSVLTNLMVVAVGYPRGWEFGHWFTGFCLISAVVWCIILPDAKEGGQ